MNPFWLVLKGMATAISGLSDIVPGWVWLTMFSGALMHGCVIGNQRDAARRDFAALKTRHEEQEAMRSEVARAAEAGRRGLERNHQAELAAINKRTSDEQKRIDAAVRAALDSVRNRPDRPAGGAGLPKDPSGNVACTGAQLYRPDAQFLVREAGRADRVRSQLTDCRAKYDAGVTLTGGWEKFSQQMNNFTTRMKGLTP